MERDSLSPSGSALAVWLATQRDQHGQGSGSGPCDEKSRWLDTFGSGTLSDVGANTGQFERGFLQQRPESLVYSSLPVEDCFPELKREMAGAPGFNAFNIALGDSEGSDPLLPFASKITFKKLALRKVDAFAHGVPIRGGLLIKIAVQGADAPVLTGGRCSLDRADAAIAEVGYLSLYDRQESIADVSSALAENGLTFMEFVDQYVRPGDSLPIYGDAHSVKLGSLGQVAAVRQADRQPQATPGTRSMP